jgi:hypothetical protein
MEPRNFIHVLRAGGTPRFYFVQGPLRNSLAQVVSEHFLPIDLQKVSHFQRPAGIRQNM